MTTELTTASFGGDYWQDQIAAEIALSVLTGAPFARNLSQMPSSKPSVAFPRAAPSGFNWVGEGAALPTVDLNDDSYVVASAKLAGVFTMSNESVDDDSGDIAGLLGRAVSDSMSPSLDDGLLFGAGGTEPVGVMDIATEVPEQGDFRSTIIHGWADMVDRGAMADAVVAFCSASTLGWEMSRVDGEGRPLHPDGNGPTMLGPVRLIAVPTLSGGETLLVDTAAVYTIVRSDFAVDFSKDAAFASDGTMVRVRGRFSVAAPTPLKSLRKITSAS